MTLNGAGRVLVGLVLLVSPHVALAASVVVPVVECPGEGAGGPMSPSGAPKFVRIDLQSPASEVALFVSAGFPAGVVGPRGFACSDLGDSKGPGIAIWSGSQKPDEAAENAPEFVIVRIAFGQKSGRCEAAAVLGPLFPAARAFVENIQTKQLCGSDTFRLTPPEGERLDYLSDGLVRFVDPPLTRGSGTANPTDRPVQGAVEMHLGTFDAVTFRSRFTTERQHLAGPLVDYFLSQSPLCASSKFRPCTGAPVAVRAPDIYSNIVTLGSTSKTVIPMVPQGGVFAVPVTINGKVTLRFLVDSGASHTSIPADIVSSLMKNGTLTNADFGGSQKYQLADGTTVVSRVFRIRSLQVGDKIVENVIGSVANARGSSLLGQSFLSRFQSWSIDNQKHALVLE